MKEDEIINHKNLVLYEMPKIAQFISNDYLQEVLAKYLILKVDRKLKRYREYLRLKEFVEKHEDELSSPNQK